MRNNSEPPPALPPALQRVIPAFRLGGWISFWVQVVLAVVASIIFLFAILFETSSSGTSGNASNPGTSAGIFFAVGGIIALLVSIYWSFRYSRLALQLKAPQPSLRPKKIDAIKFLRLGVGINLLGMFLSLLAAESISGILLGKALQSQAAQMTFNRSVQQLIQPLDIFVILANTHTLFAHFIGLVTGLWVIDWINKPSNE
jgi:hypothetical protein